MFGIAFETLQAFGYAIWARNAFTYRADGSGVYVCIPIEEFGHVSDGVMYVGSALGVWLISK